MKNNIFRKYISYEKQKIKFLWYWFISIFLLFSVYLGYTCLSLYQDQTKEDEYWEQYLKEHNNLTKDEKTLSKDATKIFTGIYIENLEDVNIKNSYYKIKFHLWFRWQGEKEVNMLDNYNIYKGRINSQEVLKNYSDGLDNYQLAEVTATVAKTFWTKRFPLGSYQLRLYIQPKQGLKDILIIPDEGNSSVNDSLNIAGFTLDRWTIGRCIQTNDSSKGDPTVDSKFKLSELMAAVELNRKGLGLYVKCFIALVGTLGWVLIVLFICTYHNVDPLGMVPSALFGTVTNILVGANLVEDALNTGLLEYVNIFGILIILVATLAIIMINRIRDYYKDNSFASFFGKHLFWLITFFALFGNIVLPIAAYKF